VKKIIIFLFIFLDFCFMKTYLDAAPVWQLVWSDEFDYQGYPDSNKWGYDIGAGGWGNQELQYYTNRLENARVENGRLIIEARKENYGGAQYTSARLKTRYKGDWLYGRIEVRAKLPGGTGTWPAIWMLPTDNVYGGWPNSGEIDIMECVGYDPWRVYFTIHTAAYNHMLGTQKGSSTILNDPQNNFYTYALEWYPDRLDFYVDNVKYFTFYKEKDDYTVWPFDQRFYLILNIAVGGTWGGAQGVDPNVFPQRMEVEYVRVYQLVDNPNIVSLNVAVNPPNVGEVVISPLSSTYTVNSQVVLEARSVNSMYEFCNWSGDLSGNKNPTSLVLNTNKNVTANFTTSIYKIYANKVSSTSIKVDGVLDEQEWDLKYSISKVVSGSYNNTAKFGVLWDDRYLYLGVDVIDSSLISQDSTNIWDDDSVEVYIDVAHDHKPSYDTYDTQYIKGYGVTSLWEKNNRTSGVLHSYYRTQNGYSIEMGIPWANLNVVPSSGMVLGFDVGINDDDNGGGRDGQAMYAGTSNNYLTTQYFGDLILTINVSTYTTNNPPEEEKRYVLTTYVEPENSGVVVVSPYGVEFPEGTKVDLTAIPKTGYKFKEWIGPVLNVNSSTTSVIMDSDKQVIAKFEEVSISTDNNVIKTYNLNFVVIPEAAGEVVLDPPGGVYTENTLVMIQAKPKPGYKFLNWSGDITGTQNPIAITLNSDKVVVANFEKIDENKYIFKQEPLCYPNPVRGGEISSVTIKFELKNVDNNYEIKATIFDTAGKLIKKLNIESQNKTAVELLWDLKDYNSKFVPSGIYFVNIVVKEKSTGKTEKKILKLAVIK
jgi:beta-glucanase (GH16 family)/ribosomal protein S19